LTFEELRTYKNIQFSRSLLIAGPKKSGKSMLTNAICTETGSLKVELTLKNVSENYPELSDINQLVKNIIKVILLYVRRLSKYKQNHLLRYSLQKHINQL